jgi:AcrR family transcriptional regulator
MCDHDGMPRPRNQASRRAQLIDAAATAVVRVGGAAVKLRDVAEAAGVTPASVLYYYSDVRELLAAVYERATATYVRRREQAIAAAAGPVRQLRVCVDSGIPWPGEAATSTRLLFELYPVALRDEALGDWRRDLFERQVECYRQVLQHGADTGEFTLSGDAAALGRSFVALEDGYAMGMLAGGMTVAEIESALYAHALQVTGHPAFAEPAAGGAGVGQLTGGGAG